jgi:hypothetical protein
MPERLPTRLVWLDRVLVVLVLLLTFFLASFAASNSDLWRHLAAGRLIAHGQLRFGTDPFAYTTADVRWVNHAWLWDLVQYLVCGAGDGEVLAFGGAPLVLIKALALTALAAVLLLSCRPAHSLWIAAACVALAVVAMSPFFLLQPRYVSLVFLGVTIYLLTRSAREKSGGPAPAVLGIPRSLLFIPLLFAVWANMDSWFLLGPLTVGLYLLGEAIEQMFAGSGADAGRRSALRGLVVALVAGLAACLLNPQHVHAFGLPPEIWTAPDIADAVPWFKPLSSPLSRPYFNDRDMGLNPAGLAYYPLVLLGLASFVLNSETRGWRVAIWTAFFLASTLRAPFIPFFAVVAGPVSALNLQDYARLRMQRARQADRVSFGLWSLAGRCAGIVAGLALVALAWQGWLNARRDDARVSRRVDWTVRVDLSYRQAAARLHALHQAWREQGLAEDQARGVNLAPETANYCAWFAPEEKAFFDDRFELFPQQLRALAMFRQALARKEEARPETGPARISEVWGETFGLGSQRAPHIVLSGPGREDVMPITRLLWRGSLHWAWLYGDGRTEIFGRRDWPRNEGTGARSEGLGTNGQNVSPLSPDLFLGQTLELNQMAFGPRARTPESEEHTANTSYQGNAWKQFWHGPVPRPLAVDAALQYLDYFAETAQWWPTTVFAAEWPTTSFAAAWMGPAFGTPYPCINGWILPAIAPGLLPPPGQVGPPALPLLAVQSAQQAVRASPESIDAYLALAAALLQLSGNQRRYLPPPTSGKRPAEPGSPAPSLPASTGEPFTTGRELVELRQVQIVTALNRALVFKPNAPELHFLLAQIYEETRFHSQEPTHLDLALEHWRLWLKYFRAAGPIPGRETAAAFDKRLADATAFVEAREKGYDLQTRSKQYEASLSRLQGLAQVQAALDLGLANDALEALGDSSVSTPAASHLRLGLLLSMGQVEEAREADIARDGWYDALAWLALGDYHRADTSLDQLIHQRQASGTGGSLDLYVFRGLLALEQGDTAQAARHLADAKRLSQEAGKGYPTRVLGARYLALLQAQAAR